MFLERGEEKEGGGRRRGREGEGRRGKGREGEGRRGKGGKGGIPDVTCKVICVPCLAKSKSIPRVYSSVASSAEHK